MVFSTSTQPAQPTQAPLTTAPSLDAQALMGLLLLTVAGARMSRKAVRKMKRQLLWSALKTKAKSLFAKPRNVSDRTLIYIIAAVAFVALLLIDAVAALILALVVLILLLAGVI